MPPTHTRWISRYSGGRLIFMPVPMPSLPGALTRCSWARSHSRLKVNVSTDAGSKNGPM